MFDFTVCVCVGPVVSVCALRIWSISACCSPGVDVKERHFLATTGERSVRHGSDVLVGVLDSVCASGEKNACGCLEISAGVNSLVLGECFVIEVSEWFVVLGVTEFSCCVGATVFFEGALAEDLWLSSLVL